MRLRIGWMAVVGVMVFAAACAAPGASATKAPAKAEAAKPADEPLDRNMGDYEGTFTPAGGAAAKAEAQVIVEGAGKYRALLLVPSAGGAKAARVELAGKEEGGKIVLTGAEWKGAVQYPALTAESKDGKFAARWVLKKSPTEGARPPAGAVVLLPYAEGKPTSVDEWTNATWPTLPDGSIAVGKGDNRTKRQFGDMQLHLEFRIPFEPSGKGQGRGNSGVFPQDRYEIQVLDSYGLVPESHECAAVYTFTAPKENACFPPGSWQTYDITFQAPRLDADGKKVKDAVVTIIHNGVKVHDQQAIKGPTGSRGKKPEVAKESLVLQDHSHPVRFRNMWVVELPPAGGR